MFTCPVCEAEIELTDVEEGEVVSCPDCGAALTREGHCASCRCCGYTQCA